MDKFTHQVRAEHWARILNECMNSGMSKTAWCRANEISEKQFTGSASCAGKHMKHLRIRPCPQLQKQNRPEYSPETAVKNMRVLMIYRVRDFLLFL